MDDDPLDAALDTLSLTEFVAHVQSMGDRSAHKGMSRGMLKKLYLSALETDEVPAEELFDPLRREVMDYIKSRQGRITLSCHGNCFLHSAGLVALCHTQMTNKD